MAMLTIADVRAKFPQYESLSDGDLANAIHTKYYSGMDRGEFDNAIGYKGQLATEVPAQRPAQHPVSAMTDFVAQAQNLMVPSPTPPNAAPSLSPVAPSVTPTLEPRTGPPVQTPPMGQLIPPVGSAPALPQAGPTSVSPNPIEDVVSSVLAAGGVPSLQARVAAGEGVMPFAPGQAMPTLPADTVVQPEPLKPQVDLTGVDPDPEGTAAGRALTRGALRTRATVPYIMATANNMAIRSSQRTEAEILEDAFREVTGITGDMPEGTDLSSVESASASISKMGYPPNYPEMLRGIYDKRVGFAEDARANPEKYQNLYADYLTSGESLIQRAASLPMSPAGERTKLRLAAGTSVGETFSTFLSHPLDSLSFFGEVGIESAPQIAATVATTAATRSPALGAAALGFGTISQEYGSSASEFLHENNVQLQSKQDAIDLLNNPDLLRLAGERGMTRGVIIAAFEMLGQGAAAKGFMQSPAGEALINIGVQMATGGGGELAAQVASGQEVNWQEIIIEGLAEGITAPVEVYGAVRAGSTRRGKPDEAPDAATATPTPPQLGTEQIIPETGEVRTPDMKPAEAQEAPAQPATPEQVAEPVVEQQPDQPAPPDPVRDVAPPVPDGDPVIPAGAAPEAQVDPKEWQELPGVAGPEETGRTYMENTKTDEVIPKAEFDARIQAVPDTQAPLPVKDEPQAAPEPTPAPEKVVTKQDAEPEQIADTGIISQKEANAALPEGIRAVRRDPNDSLSWTLLGDGAKPLGTFKSTAPEGLDPDTLKRMQGMVDGRVSAPTAEKPAKIAAPEEKKAPRVEAIKPEDRSFDQAGTHWNTSTQEQRDQILLGMNPNSSQDVRDKYTKTAWQSLSDQLKSSITKGMPDSAFTAAPEKAEPNIQEQAKAALPEGYSLVEIKKKANGDYSAIVERDENGKRESGTGSTPEGAVDTAVAKLYATYGEVGKEKLESGKPSTDSRPTDTKLLGDSPIAKPLISEGFDSLDRDTQGVVVSQVIMAIDDSKILNSIIETVPVDVMNVLVGKKVSTDILLNNPSMLTDRLTVPSEVSIPQSVVDFIDALPASISDLPTSLTTKKPSLDEKPGSVNLPDDGDAASIASGPDNRHGKVLGQDVVVDINPSDKQKEAGNYLLGSVSWNGLQISVENLKGSERSGTDSDGETWSVTMPAHYGYIKRTEGADGDHVDIYMGEYPESAKVFVIDQVNLDRTFDEHKVMLGFRSNLLARGTHAKAFSDGLGEQRRGGVTEMTVAEFRGWLENGDQSKPLSKDFAGKEQADAPKVEEVPAEPEFDPYTVKGWRDTAIEVEDEDGGTVTMKAGEIEDIIAEREDQAQQLLRCLNG